MTALTVIGIILLILLLLGCIPLGVDGEYSEDGILIRAKLGPLRFTLYPLKKKEKKVKTEKKTQDTQKKEAPPPEKKKRGGLLSLLREMLPLAMEALGSFKRRLHIDLFTLHLVWAAPDPASAAMGYGAANAAVGMIYSVLEEHFRIKKWDTQISVDFEQKQPRVYLRAVLTMTVGRLVTFGIYFGLRALLIWSKHSRQPAKREKKEAKAHE